MYPQIQWIFFPPEVSVMKHRRMYLRTIVSGQPNTNTKRYLHPDEDENSINWGSSKLTKATSPSKPYLTVLVELLMRNSLILVDGLIIP